MAFYRKKPIVIEAFKYGIDDAPKWFFEAITRGEIDTTIFSVPPYCIINTLEGMMRAEIGDYIIKGIKDEIYPCKSDIFEQSYELV